MYTLRKGFITMNKEELVQEIAKKAKVTQKDASEVLGALVDTIQKTVAKGKKLPWLASEHLNHVRELLETAGTLKLVKKLKSLQKQYLLSQLVKNSKLLLMENSF